MSPSGRRPPRLPPRATAAVACVASLLATTTAFGTEGLGGSCLDGAPAAGSLKRLVVGGVTVPLGVWRYEWDSGRVFSYIYAQLARDALGYDVVWSGATDTCGPGMLAVAGCDAPFNYTHPQCNGSPGQTTHVVLEFWTTVAYNIGWLQTHYPASVPEDLGSVGYASTQGLYVRGAQCEAAQAVGLQLQYYFFYNSGFYNLTAYFDDHRAIPKADLQLCSSSGLNQPAAMSKVVKFAPDPGGFAAGPNGLQAKCPDGYWWLSPACRDSPSRCLPFVTGGDGWYLTQTMQRAIIHSIPLAVAVLAGDAQYISIPHRFRVMNYWWEPDQAFLDLSYTQITFPPYNSTEYAQGNSQSNELDVLLTKNVYNKLSAVAPKAYALARQMTLDMSTLKALLADLGASRGDVQGTTCRWLRANSAIWKAWMPKDTDCTAGYGLVGLTNDFVANRKAAVDCAPCGPGNFSDPVLDLEGTTHVCRACPPGRVQAQRGSEACDLCEAGYHQNEAGQSLCKRCDKGSFAPEPGSSACTGCPGGKTTDGTGFRSQADCQCAAGAYMAKGTGGCTSCGEGAECLGFGSEPVALPGYQLTDVRDDGLSIFRCFGGSRRCSGGGIGECAEGREGIACAVCHPGMTSSGTGGCRPCAKGDSAPFAVSFIVALVLLAAMYHQVSQDDRAKQSTGVLILLMNGSQVVTVVQVVGVFARLAVNWPEPVRSVLSMLRVCSLDIQILRMECLGTAGPVGRYFTTIALLPGGLVYIVLVHVCAQAARRLPWLQRVLPVAAGSDPLVGSTGTFFMALFIAVVTATMAPLQCQQHPNGLWTMVQYESVLCWQGGVHSAMIAGGMCVMLLPIAFVAAVVCVIYVFPRRMQQGDVRFLNTFTFLFCRVRPGTRWFTLGLLLRNLLIAFVPAIPQTFAQMVLLQAVFWVSLLLIMAYSPWRVHSSNRLDVATHLGLASFVYLATFLVTDMDVQLVALFAAITVAAGLSLLVVAAAASALKVLVAPRKRFQWFLCHHKAAAGATTRLLKMALLESQGSSRGDVFIDSDNLEDLEQLFSVVAHEVRSVVVLCNKELFRRTWCLGEVATAYVNHVEAVAVQFPDFVQPDDEFIGNLSSNVEVNILSEGGLTIEQAQQALRWFRSLDPIQMPGALDRGVITKLVRSIRAVPGSDPPTRACSLTPGSLTHAHLEARAAILSDSGDREATAAALILQKLLVPLLQHDPALVPVLCDELLHSAGGAAGVFQRVATLLVFCTGGCFREPGFLSRLMCAMHEGVATALPIVVRDDFRFPTPAFYADLEQDAAELSRKLEAKVQIESEQVRRYVESMFKKIALVFNTMGSLEVLESEASSIQRRLVHVTAAGAITQGRSLTPTAPNVVALLMDSAKEPEEKARACSLVGIDPTGTEGELVRRGVFQLMEVPLESVFKSI